MQQVPIVQKTLSFPSRPYLLFFYLVLSLFPRVRLFSKGKDLILFKKTKPTRNFFNVLKKSEDDRIF